MIRILRAFAWMRWRVLVNSLEVTGARDAIERLSVAVEQIGPIIAILVLLPSSLALGALSAFAGYTFGQSGESVAFEVLRYLLLTSLGLCLVGPILMPVAERTNAVRLLLLPISRKVLYVAQSVTAIADPWILLTIPIVLFLPAGLAAGGAIGAAAAVLAAGLLLLATLLGISSLVTTVLHLLVRDRRRGELLALLFVVVVPLIAMLPGMIDNDLRAERRGQPPRAEIVPAWVRDTSERAFRVLPSELFTTAARQAVTVGLDRAALPVAGLAVTTIVLHGVGLLAFAKVLDSSGSSTARRTGRSSGKTVRIPGLSSGTSAIAVSQVRLAFRTPRGRAVLLSPLGVFMMFALLMRRGGGDAQFGMIALGSGLALATFASVVCLLALLPFAMNQFAIDRAGLTMVLLSPLSERQILAGKAIGNGIIAALPSIASLFLSYALFPAGSLALWVSIPVGVLATYVLATPAAAALSAVFPRAVDLNSIGQKSNAHGLAGLLGMASFAMAALPPVLLTLISTRLLMRAELTPLLLAGWCAVALVAARLLLHLVASLLHRRRENLALIGART